MTRKSGRAALHIPAVEDPVEARYSWAAYRDARGYMCADGVLFGCDAAKLSAAILSGSLCKLVLDTGEQVAIAITKVEMATQDSQATFKISGPFPT